MTMKLDFFFFFFFLDFWSVCVADACKKAQLLKREKKAKLQPNMYVFWKYGAPLIAGIQ